MKIGIIGAGNMGAAFARRLAAVDHEITITAKGLDKTRKVASEVGRRVRAMPREELAKGTDLIILATPYDQSVEALRAVRHVDGKAVIDISNPFKEDMSGLVVGHTTSAAEEIQRAVPNVKVVKAFNTVFAAVLGSQPGGGSKVQVLYAGDDAGAKDDRAATRGEHRVRAGRCRPSGQRSIPGAARHVQHLARLYGQPGYEHRAAVGNRRLN